MVFTDKTYTNILKNGLSDAKLKYFNVKDYNPRALKSMDLHEYVKNICEEIFEHLVIKSSDFLYLVMNNPC
jgi:hypothetical protein